MVRILKVKQLEDRKRFLLSKSEIYRQSLKLEIANVKVSLALLKRKFKFIGASAGILGAVAPLAGFFIARKKSRRPKQKGFLSRVFTGLKLAGQLKPLLKGFQMRAGQRNERETSNQVR
ncbi:MAG: hypothetical protein JWR26_1934 [Pedosphaera sp.]|nr:hypothetical protein [Pedosphaera sp.]